jgi:hypothetical protein
MDTVPFTSSHTTKKMRMIRILKISAVALVVVLLVSAGGVGAITLVRKYPSRFGIQSAVQNAATKEAESLVEKVGKLMSLPTDEKPTVATVSDSTKLGSQPFFKSAKNGDRVLIYASEKKAILYRPSENRIIDVGSVSIKQQEQGQVAGATTESPSPSPKSTSKKKQTASPSADLAATPQP